MKSSAEENNYTGSHKMQITNRNQGIINGVIDVVSFDLNEILLETHMGMMSIKGSDMKVKRLSLEKGEVEIEGQMDSFIYSDLKKYKKSKESLMGRLFK